MAATTATSPAVDIGELVTINVRMLLARDGLKVKDLLTDVDIPQSTLYRRMKRHDWTVHEAAMLADHFAIPMGAIYADPRIARQPTDGMPANLPTRSQRPLVRAA